MGAERRIERNGNNAGIEAHEECRDVLQTGWEQDQNAVAWSNALMQPDGDLPGAAVQISVRQVLLVSLAVGKKRVPSELRRFRGPEAQHVEQTRPLRGGA